MFTKIITKFLMETVTVTKYVFVETAGIKKYAYYAHP